MKQTPKTQHQEHSASDSGGPPPAPPGSVPPFMLPGAGSFYKGDVPRRRWKATTSQWRDEFERRLVSPEDAVKHVKTGDRVWLSAWQNPESLLLALVARAGELRDVEIEGIPLHDYWFLQDVAESFRVRVIQAVDVTRPALANKAADFVPWWVYLAHKAADEGRPGARPIDVTMLSVTPPNDQGYCNFGHTLWDAKDRARKAALVLAEVNDQLPTTFGDTWIHITEIDWFVTHSHLPTFFDYPDPADEERRMAENVAELLRDGDALQLGTGRPTAALSKLDILRSFKELGFFSEMTMPGVLDLVRDGVITSERVNPNPGITVTTALGHNEADMAFVDRNPRIAVMPVSYVHNPRVISSIDNMVSVNCAMSIDLTGQIAAGALGSRVWSGTGGQLAFALGALMSNGGRYICVMPSTAAGGGTSRIVPRLPEGQLITVPRELADIVVTEHGVAHLLNRSERERARELIAVAHPDHREDLRRAAAEMYGV